MISIYTPRSMGKIVERLPRRASFFRDMFFKNEQTYETTHIDFDFVKGSQSLAPYVHPKLGGKTIANDGYTTKSYTPPLLAPNRVTTVADVEMRMAGEQLYGGMSAAERATKKLANDFKALKASIDRRIEYQAATSLLTGTIPVIGEGINEVIDFGFTNTEKITNASKKWSGADADPLSDLEKWIGVIHDKGFVNPDVVVLGSTAAAAFLDNAKVQKALDMKDADIMRIKPKSLPSGAVYLGTWNKYGIDFYEYNGTYLDDWTDPTKPATYKLMSENKVLVGCTEADFELSFSAITQIDQKTQKVMTVEGAYVPDTWITKNPDRRFLGLSSRPITVPKEVDSWFVAEVL